MTAVQCFFCNLRQLPIDTLSRKFYMFLVSIFFKKFQFFFGFGWGALPRFLAGRAKLLQTHPLKRSFVTFDRGGQTGPPRSNDFFRRR